MRVKNWAKFQHFKDRSPPWIKLYRELLDDPDWHELDGLSAKVLTMIWLIASEDETHGGLLPDERKLAFRMRITQQQLKQCLAKLSHWVEQDDIEVISGRYQVATPETETETETDSRFAEFWSAYPRKVGKAAAEKAFAKAKINGEFDSVVTALAKQAAACKDLQFFPHPATWLNGKRWEDEITTTTRSDLGVFV